jgi:2-polyprenyl-3-methyl-5-hydroxy-6-metoxy-1,4-benzoquinol methylase
LRGGDGGDTHPDRIERMTSTALQGDCAICTARQVDLRWRTVQSRSLTRCTQCGFAWFERSQYQDASVREQYLADATSPAEYYDRVAEHDDVTFGIRMRMLTALLGGRSGKVLDVGCNVGSFLRAAGRAGLTPVGVEPNPQAAQKARDKGFEVHTGFFEDALARRIGPFDAVHMGDVIEHVFDPIEMLRTAASALRVGGVLMVVTPDLDSIMARLLQIKPEEHLVYFTQRSLGLAAESAGFENVEVQRWGRRRSMAAMPYSTTFSGIGKRLVQLVNLPGIRPAVELTLFHAFKDELLLTARRA